MHSCFVLFFLHSLISPFVSVYSIFVVSSSSNQSVDRQVEAAVNQSLVWSVGHYVHQSIHPSLQPSRSVHPKSLLSGPSPINQSKKQFLCSLCWLSAHCTECVKKKLFANPTTMLSKWGMPCYHTSLPKAVVQATSSEMYSVKKDCVNCIVKLFVSPKLCTHCQTLEGNIF